MKEIYLDNAATTQMYIGVYDAMRPYLLDDYHNPSAIYKSTFKIREAIEHAREQIAKAVNCDPDLVFFTSGGTEADNWIIREFLTSHIYTSTIEHKAVLEACHKREKETYTQVTYIPVDMNGAIHLGKLDSELAKAPKRPLVSIMTANNEIGTIQPLRTIGKLAYEADGFFHTDAVQAIGTVPIDMQKMGINFLSMSAHKFHGPKGIGALCCNVEARDVPIPFIVGGSQQFNMRAGTENVPAIVGMGKAIELTMRNMDERNTNIGRLRDYLQDLIISDVPEVIVNGGYEPYSDHPKRLPNNLNVSFKGIDGQQLLAMLDNRGISVSAGSACNAEDVRPSHVLTAIKVPKEYINGTIRFSLSEYTTKDDIVYTAMVVTESVKALREMHNA